MNNLDLILDGSVSTTLWDFIKANTDEAGNCSIEKEDIAAIKMLFADQSHYIACGENWCKVTRVVNLRAFGGRQYAEDKELDQISTREEAFIFSLENPAA